MYIFKVKKLTNSTLLFLFLNTTNISLKKLPFLSFYFFKNICISVYY